MLSRRIPAERRVNPIENSYEDSEFALSTFFDPDCRSRISYGEA